MGSGVGGILLILNLIGIYPEIPWFIGFTIMAVCLFVGSLWAYLDVFKNLISIRQQPNVVLKSKKYLDLDDLCMLDTIENFMKAKHGHMDIDGITTDIKAGYVGADLYSRNCLKCGKPRNQKGDLYL